MFCKLLSVRKKVLCVITTDILYFSVFGDSAVSSLEYKCHLLSHVELVGVQVDEVQVVAVMMVAVAEDIDRISGLYNQR